jgi:hypothetical protein
VSCEGTQAETLDALEDLVGALDPNEGLRDAIAHPDVQADRVLQRHRRAVDTALELPTGQLRESALDLVDP